MTKHTTIFRITILGLIAMPYCSGCFGNEPQWKEGIAKLEKPLVDFRKNFGQALIRHSAALQNKGRIEDVKKMSEVIKLYESGDWPEVDSRILGNLEGNYIIHFERIRKQFEKTIRSAAAKINDPAFNAMAEEKMKYWRQPWGPYKLLTERDRLIAYQWKVKGSIQMRAGGDNPALTGNPKKSTKEILENAGITFQPGASAFYNTGDSTVIVRNQAGQLILVDEFLSSTNLQ